ncbi:MAG: hypothetical protein GY820_25405 [Gammaproteobacteria bacterium]|nr:hypothetical protein [Gammaproteobacteria bacterium]
MGVGPGRSRNLRPVEVSRTHAMGEYSMLAASCPTASYPRRVIRGELFRGELSRGQLSAASCPRRVVPNPKFMASLFLDSMSNTKGKVYLQTRNGQTILGM